MKNHSIRNTRGTGGQVAGENLNETHLHLGSPEHVQALMKDLGWDQKLTLPVLAASLDLAGKTLNREVLVMATREFFSKYAALVPEGIETLPACWLKDLPNLVLRTLKAHWIHVPYMITRMSFVDGVLCMSFAQETDIPMRRFSRWDELRVTINRALRPNLWKELTRQEKAELIRSCPELGGELLRLPSSDMNASGTISDAECAEFDQDIDY